MMIKGIKVFYTYLMIFLSSVIIVGSFYIRKNFSNQRVDEMIYYLFNGLEGVSKDVFIEGIMESFLPFLFLFFLLIAPIIQYKNSRNIIEIRVNKRKYQFTVFPIQAVRKYRLVYSTIIFLLALLISYFTIGIDEYVNRMSDYSTIIEDYYVDGRNVTITFPEEKRNLIILYLESMENTFMDRENGGAWQYNIIPELTELAQHYLNFSHTDKLGGPLSVPGTEWTVAAMVASSAGIPLKIPIGGNSYTNSDNFLKGAFALGDILKEAGYNLQLMVGSDANYGGRSNYYLAHGTYEIFDVHTAIARGKMNEEDKVWWGFADSQLFTWAKEEITKLAQKNEPFSFTFLTVNTHFPDGYLEEGVNELYPTQYENVLAHSAQQVAEFVNWFKEQEFSERTTLVIIGDHESMQQEEYFHARVSPDYERTTYNVFINSLIEPIQSNNRQFSIFDMYPTMLASIGVQIEGDRLGLGTNLFSERPTIIEELGIDYVRDELEKQSNFYNRYILKDDYLDLLHQDEEEY